MERRAVARRAPGICLKMRIRADCLAEMSHNAARRHAGRHALKRNWEDLVAKWVESKNVGGVSEVTLLTPIKKGFIPGEGRTYEQRLHQALTLTQERIANGYPTAISTIPTIHFARWLILRPQQYLCGDVDPRGRLTYGATNLADDTAIKLEMEKLTSWLFFTSNFDGDMMAYLRDFAVFLGEDLDHVWGNCEGYPAKGASRDFDGFWAYAKKYQLTTHAFYNAYPGLSVPRIHQLAAFKDLFDAFVARTRDGDGRSIEGLAEAFDQFVAETACFPSAFPDAGGMYRIPVPTGEIHRRGAG